MLKGKVWPRGETGAERLDHSKRSTSRATCSGSPGLFGNANDSEIMIDNISVTPNAT